ncbi:MAG TPA: hypothetical protein VFR81_27705 [Longimicrobium sp.]|nr:hypothetical protein [Longimicrobium sp.]
MKELRREPILSGVPIPPPVPPPPPAPGAPPPPPPLPEPPPPPEPGNPVVRAVGDHLVMLRKGRLFTVRIAGGALEVVPPSAARGDTRFQELVVLESGDVIAFAHDGRAAETEAAVFRVGEDGRAARRGGWRIRATADLWRGNRITLPGDGRIVFFDQREIALSDSGFTATMPAVRDAADAPWRITAPPTRIHRPVFPLTYGADPTLHTVTVCDPAAGGASCRSTALYAPNGRISHVSRSAAYLRTEHYDAAPDDEDDPDRKVLYRIPFDGSPATALVVTGAPRDEDSFLESADGHLNALVLHDGWTEESRNESPVPALFRLPLGEMGDGTRSAARDRYRHLPDFSGLHYNRFVGDWAVYGNRPFGEYLVSSGLFTEARASELGVGAVRWAGVGAPAWMPLGRGVESIVPLDSTAALVVATDGRATELALVRLDGAPRIAGRAPRPGLGTLEGRMYGEVAHRREGGDAGVIGLTVGSYPQPFHFRAESAAFFRYDAGGLRQIGEIGIAGEPAGSFEVVPVLAGGRIFAVVGEALVEMVEEGGRLREARRVVLP